MNRSDKRDNFSAKTKRDLASRAGFQCSFEECRRPTIGPSSESSKATVSSGEAAHIHAASPDGARYCESMTPEQRSHIDNGIWLCARHAKIIDRDKATYSPERLHEMKDLHEPLIKNEHEHGISIVAKVRGHKGADLALFTFWKRCFDIDVLYREMVGRHTDCCDIIISEAFVTNCIRFIQQCESALSDLSLSGSLKFSLKQFFWRRPRFYLFIE